MKANSRTAFYALAWPQFWYFAFIILAVIPIVLVFAFFPFTYNWYLQNFVEPELEKTLGFRLGQVRLTTEARGSYEISAVVSIQPGGVFDRAGVQLGDIPYGYVHGLRYGFLDHLNSSRGETATFQFINKADAEKGLWKPRVVSIMVPRKAPPN